MSDVRTDIRVEETVWITLPDGCRLAARLWLPSADTGPVPAILEYLPYRRRDRHRGDDAILHPAFAEAGYAAIRVDMRGAGDSDGVMEDEYTEREWTDAVDVIAWIASQSWCDGNVGMIGLSWSGFNGLQIAAKAPPALKAIVTTCASDDRFADDMHYMGGCLLNDNLQYGATLFTWLGTPPDPEIVGDKWREMWLRRLDKVSPPAARWMSHSDRDAYWQSGSVCEDYSRVKAAVLAVGGWADGYTNAVMRLLAGLPGPRKGLIGPWAHAFPHVATPGPQIDFLGYVIRWWDHWLKGRDTGIMAEPMLTCWLQESERPRARYTERRGRWIAEATWPSSECVPLVRQLTAGRLVAGQEPKALDIVVQSPATTGIASGEWCPYGWGPDMPTDQGEDDAGSRCFDDDILAAPFQLLGGARLTVSFSSDRPEAMLAVRLNDVAPDGSISRITYGLINLQHHAGHESAIALVPGQRYQAIVRLKDVAYEMPVGHRLRVAISTVYWPLAMPVPMAAQVTIHEASLTLPQRLTGSFPAVPPQLGTARGPAPLAVDVLTPPARGRLKITRDLAENRTVVDVVRNLGAIRIKETGLELQALGSEAYSISPDDPATAHSVAMRRAEFKRDDWHAAIVTKSELRAEGSDWRFVATLDAFEGETRLFSRSWNVAIPRSTAGRK
ncbi:CocE/NonD family hydrolase [Dongia sp.]|uniref:CocE/NonD family hydrolase n=1 Tax=Dongia sp. TaxID=1977262 RepID=UPI0035B3726B